MDRQRGIKNRQIGAKGRKPVQNLTKRRKSQRKILGTNHTPEGAEGEKKNWWKVADGRRGKKIGWFAKG